MIKLYEMCKFVATKFVHDLDVPTPRCKKA